MAGAAKFDKALFTAKFKRDYVAYSAIGLFILIVLTEVALAVSIPTYFVRSNLWDLQIARQDLLRDFDHLRNQCNHFAGKTPELAGENNILLWNLNLMSQYIRENEKRLNREEIRSLKEDLTQMRMLHNQLTAGKAFNRFRTLDNGTALGIIRAELTEGGKK